MGCELWPWYEADRVPFTRCMSLGWQLNWVFVSSSVNLETSTSYNCLKMKDCCACETCSTIQDLKVVDEELPMVLFLLIKNL